MLCWNSLSAALLYLAFKIAFVDSTDTTKPIFCGTIICKGNEECRNTPDGPICKCVPGYEHLDGYCQDIDECAIDECGDIPCVNHAGTYICNCPLGFEFNKTNKACADVDECSSGVNECGIDRECSNTEGSFDCVCYEGFKDVKPDFCQDIDECLIPDVCGEKGECINDEGYYNCTCPTGYGIISKKCEDINECETKGPDRKCPEEQQCINNEGSYTCELCPDGLTLNTTANKCEGPDLCMPNPCMPPATCETENGDFICSCPPGYEIKGKTECQEIKENKEIDVCEANPCGADGKCKKDGKSFKCECKSGFKFITTKGCVDIDECTMNLCKELQICSNSQGSYECKCPKAAVYDEKTGCKFNAMPVVVNSYRPLFSPFCDVTLMTMSYFCYSLMKL